MPARDGGRQAGREIRRGEEVLASGHDATWAEFQLLAPEKARQREAVAELEQGAIGDVNHRIERLRLAARRVELSTASAATVPSPFAST